MQKIIARVALMRRGVRKFEEEVNAALGCGWELCCVEVHRWGLLRIVCLAKLVKKCCHEEGAK